MNLIGKNRFGLGFLLICLILSGCGPSPEEKAATAAAQTAAAATNTPVPTKTPLPTNTPTPTPTSTPTPTPIPEPDPKAMIDWEALNLPVRYLSVYPHDLGIGEGDWILGIQQEDGTQVDYLIESSFVFTPSWPEAVYGWTVLFSNDFDRDVLDWYIDNFPSQLQSIVESSQGVPISLIDNSDYPEYSVIGDNSSEAWAVYVVDGEFWNLWGAAFRINEIGGFVFIRHPFGEDQVVEIGELAEIYARSIEFPSSRCRYTTITADLAADVPAFEYEVEGFYPGEPISVSLSGEVNIDGETQSVSAIDAGTDTADDQGRFHGKMRLGDEELDLMSSDFELIVLGFFSKCASEQTITWEK